MKRPNHLLSSAALSVCVSVLSYKHGYEWLSGFHAGMAIFLFVCFLFAISEPDEPEPKLPTT